MLVNPLTAWIYRKLWDTAHPDTQFVFVATTGRSGSAALKRLFQSVDRCVALHEPYPIMNADVLRAKCAGNESVARHVYWTRKAVNIRRAAGNRKLYVETNHQFIKSFHEYALDDFQGRVRVVHLRRHPIPVARSMVRLGAIPGTPDGDEWYLSFEHPGNVLRVGPDDLRTGGRFSHPYYRSLWYWYETEARIDQMKIRHPLLDVHRLDWRDRLELGAALELLDWCGRPYDAARIEVLLQKRANERSPEKQAWDVGTREMEEMHRSFRAYLADLGNEVPVLP